MLNETHNTTTIVSYGKPVPWTRTAGSGKRRYTDPKYRAWKTEFQWVAKLAHTDPLLDELVAVVTFVCSDGIVTQVTPITRWAGLVGPWVTKRPKGLRGDLDNYLKGVHDAMQQVVYSDDRLIAVVFGQWAETVEDVLGFTENGDES